MSREERRGAIRVLAEAPLLVLVNRISVPALVALCVWIATTVVETKVTMGKVEQSIADYDRRIHDLETWRFSIDEAGRTRVSRSN